MYDAMGAAPELPGHVLVGEDADNWYFQSLNGLGLFGFIKTIAKGAVGAVKGAVRGVVGTDARQRAAEGAVRGARGADPAAIARLERMIVEQRVASAAKAGMTPLLIGGAALAALLLLRR